MQIFKFERIQLLPITIEQAWAYFSNPNNLSELTPPELALHIKSLSCAEIYNGLMIEYTVKPLLGMEMPWVSEIKHVVRPFSFVDEQRVGPYKLWYHQHILKPKGDKLEVIDQIYYGLPGGPLAFLLNHFLIKRKLNEIFAFRKKVLAEKFY